MDAITMIRKMKHEDERSYLRFYRQVKYQRPKHKEAKITPSYSERTGHTNAIADQTAQIALYNVQLDKEITAFCTFVEQLVSQLPEQEQQLITMLYMQPKSMTEEQAMDAMNLASNPFRQLLNGAYRHMVEIRIHGKIFS